MTLSLAQAVREAAGSGLRLPCAEALALAVQLQADPSLVGAAADAAGVKIVRCELGLFGPRRLDAPDLGGEAARVGSPLYERLSALSATGISCATAWAVATEHGVEPLTVGHVASSLNTRIYHCQLGCF